MRYITLIYFACLLAVGCQSSDDKPECTCAMGVYAKPGIEGNYYVPNVALDCETKQPINQNIGGGYYVGCQQ